MADMTEPRETIQPSVDPITLCCACDELLGTERPLVTLMCFCRAHTECFLRDLGAKQYTDVPEICPRCQTAYVSEELSEEIHQLARAAEIEEENVRREMNPCLALNEGSPEFVTDIAKCKEIAKSVKASEKEYNILVSATVKKYKEDTKVMANILRTTQRDAILKINVAQCTKSYYLNARRFSSFISHMARRYDFSHREWMRFTRHHYPSLHHSFYRYSRHSYCGWRLRNKFRYGL